MCPHEDCLRLKLASGLCVLKLDSHWVVTQRPSTPQREERVFLSEPPSASLYVGGGGMGSAGGRGLHSDSWMLAS